MSWNVSKLAHPFEWCSWPTWMTNLSFACLKSTIGWGWKHCWVIEFLGCASGSLIPIKWPLHLSVTSKMISHLDSRLNFCNSSLSSNNYNKSTLFPFPRALHLEHTKLKLSNSLGCINTYLCKNWMHYD